MSFEPANFDDQLHAEPEEPEDVELATEKQVAYMDRLLAKLLSANTDYALKTRDSFFKAMQQHGFETTADIPKSKARVLIGWLIEHADQQKPAPVAKEQKPAVEGIHYKDGKVYKVQQSLSTGRLYAKELVHDQYTTLESKTEWRYAKGAIYNLTEDTIMTKEDAAQYGKLYGVCAICGALLTDENSIERGIGPICASKL